MERGAKPKSLCSGLVRFGNNKILSYFFYSILSEAKTIVNLSSLKEKIITYNIATMQSCLNSTAGRILNNLGEERILLGKIAEGGRSELYSCC